ncbi:MAG: S41 family peptidase [Bacteroidota bacterium]
MLSRDSLLMDLSLLETALTEMHPGLYRYASEKEVSQWFKSLRDSLPETIWEGEFFARLAQTIAKVRCGHTYLNPWNLTRSVRLRLFGGKTFFPIGFEIIDGKFYTTENASLNTDIKRAAEILKINDVPITEIYAKLKTIAKTDGNNFAAVDHYLSLWNYEASTWQAFDLYLQLFYPLKNDTFEVTYQNFGTSETKIAKVKAQTKQERAEKMITKYGKAITEKELWKIEHFTSGTSIMRLGTFATWKWKGFNAEKWFETAFKELDSLKVSKLVVDLRGNGGGLAIHRSQLASYLVKDTLRCDKIGKVYIKITKFNTELLPYIETYVELLKAGLPEDLYSPSDNGLYEFFEPDVCSDIPPRPNGYKGEVFILGNASNVSATFTLLDHANRFGYGTFVGQTTGGNRQGINGGEYAFFTMPYSKIEVDIPLKYFSSFTPQKDEGVQPKIPVKVTQKDIAVQNDPYLAKVKMMQ